MSVREALRALPPVCPCALHTRTRSGPTATVQVCSTACLWAPSTEGRIALLSGPLLTPRLLCYPAARVKASVMSNEDVLRSEVPWPSFAAAGIISREQLEMIYALDKQPTASQVAVFHEKGTAIVTLFIDIINGINKEDVICYTLAMLDEIMGADTKVPAFFPKLAAETNGAADPVKPLLKLLTRSTVFIVEKAASIIAKIVGAPIPAGAPEAVAATFELHLSSFSEWVVTALKEVDPAVAAESATTAAAMSGLQALVSTQRGRTAALEAQALLPLSTLITASSMSNSSSTVQLLYQSLFALWSFSYSPEAAMEMASSKVGLVAKLVDIVKSSPKEKVIRVGLSTMRNLLGIGSASNDMVVFGLMPVLESMQARKFADEDIPEDVELLYNTLQVNLTGLTSWDVYKTELESGKLEWSPSHKSENFWKDNFKAFEGGQCASIKQLIALLSSDDTQVLAIACNDIAEFIKFHPEGRRLMTTYGAKPLAMQAMKHPDPTVQKYALTCVQRLMVINWEYLNRQ